jgi:hypothetical protein
LIDPDPNINNFLAEKMGEMLNRQDIEKDLVRKSNHKG